MRITNLTINNYKSLRATSISPGNLTALVGANASGKSNFADCLDFISDVYRHGLELAVGRKGGYENIAFRKMRRSKSPVSIELAAELFGPDLQPYYRSPKRSSAAVLKIEHSFSFVARGSSIRAVYEVTKEEFVVSSLDDGSWSRVATMRRRKNDYTVDVVSPGKVDVERALRDHLLDFGDLKYFKERPQALPSTELVVGLLGRFIPSMYVFVQAMEGIRVFQISPGKTREFGVPTPTPQLERMGANLPAVIDMMQKQHRREWKSLMQIMRNILPYLRSIVVDYTSSRTLGLFFHEHGFGRPWSVDEVSDGTIQTLALLVAIFVPESTVLVIEEPENSVHPWIIRQILEACRDASRLKQIIITTHSPIVINAMRPTEVWVIWRSNGESHLAEISKLDPEFLPMWETGDLPTFEYIDSGALPEALPPAPTDDDDTEEEE
jgi:predicted ATPase